MSDIFQIHLAAIEVCKISHDRQPQARSRNLLIEAFADPENPIE